MNNEIKELVQSAISNILKQSTSKNKLNKLIRVHSEKIHFIPKNYRIFGGILQSMNIQFGNFLEVFMTLLIRQDGRYEILEDYNGNRNNNFELSTTNDQLIDLFISDCQNNKIQCLKTEFLILLEKIKNDKDSNISTIKHDIDLLFEEKEKGIIYYLEMKYNDDHDTGKFVDINRKFIKTYAYLVRKFPKKEITPILFFFNNKKMKGNIYVPEETNIRRGKAFFDQFLRIKYEDINSYMNNISEDPESVKMFNDLYEKIMSL